MIPLPQHGGCICGDVRFTLQDDPVTVYACHCTDCQTETGSTCVIAVVVHSAAVAYTGATPEQHGVVLADGRPKGGARCPRCKGAVGGASRGEALMMLEGGTFDDTSWLVPAGHIWTRSAQPWVLLPEDVLAFPEQPADADWLAMTVAWRQRSASD